MHVSREFYKVHNYEKLLNAVNSAHNNAGYRLG